MTAEQNTPNPSSLAAKHDSSKNKPSWLSGKLSGKVISAVFTTIIVVQGAILYYSLADYKQEQLEELGQIGKSAVAPLLNHWNDPNEAMIDVKLVQRLLATTNVHGFALFEPHKSTPVKAYGVAPLLKPDTSSPEKSKAHFYEEQARYEISFGPRTMQSNYVTVITLDAAYLDERLMNYVTQAAMLAIFLAAFITTVLVLVLGKWMIEPILLLRDNLLGVARDPTAAKSYLTPYRNRDELGSVISSANKLIKQNADHMQRISQQAQDKIYRVAFYDSLTDLPNRAHFLKRLEEILTNEEKHPHKLSVLVMDIDHFGDVNNTLGYVAGDQLLRQVAERLTKQLPDALLIARLGEDQFAVVHNITQEKILEDHIKETSDAVLKIFVEPFVFENNDLVMEGSIGMALWPDDDHRAIDLLKKAEVALDQTKLEDKGNFRLYSTDFDREVQDRIQMIQDLRTAIEEKQFTLAYQPQFCAKNLNIIGAEALLRWEKIDPVTGKSIFTRPDKFIPVAEQSGLIVPIGRWVLEEACRFAKECHNQGLGEFRIAVNLSGIQFHRDNVINLVRDVLKRTGLSAHFLELEVTESAVMKDIEQTIGLLQQLKDIGVELAIDDFGTGYSSLSYLKRFPVHRLKIDRSFIMNMTETPEDAAITKTVIQLGHAIGLKVIAEGVETLEQMKALTVDHCDEFQGYYFSKPLAGEDFKEFVRSYEQPQKRALEIV